MTDYNRNLSPQYRHSIKLFCNGLFQSAHRSICHLLNWNLGDCYMGSQWLCMVPIESEYGHPNSAPLRVFLLN